MVRVFLRKKVELVRSKDFFFKNFVYLLVNGESIF